MKMKLSCVIRKHCGLFVSVIRYLLPALGGADARKYTYRTHSKFTQDHIYISNLRHSYELCSLALTLFHSRLLKNVAFCAVYLFVYHTHRTAQRSNICEVNVWFLFLFPNVRLLTQWFWWMPTSTPNVSHHMLQSHIHHIRGTKLFIKSKAKIFSFDNGAPFFWISVEHDNVFAFLSV